MVKLKIHILFSASTALLTAKTFYVLTKSFLVGPLLLLTASLCSLLTNTLIDGLGHTRRGGYVVRTRFSHSLTGATFFGLLTSAIILIPTFLLEHFLSAPIKISVFPMKETVVLSLVCGYAHLLADLPTEGGIYYKGRRVKFGGFSYAGPINVVFLLVSALLFWLSIDVLFMS